MNNEVISRTNNYHSPNVWIRRLVGIVILAAILFVLDKTNKRDGTMIKISIVAAATLVLLIFPVDDVVVRSNSISHARTSVVGFFSSEKTFKFSDLKAIQRGASAEDQFDLITGRKPINHITLVRKDGQSVYIQLRADEDELSEVLDLSRRKISGNI
jgi:hypothetical protein